MGAYFEKLSNLTIFIFLIIITVFIQVYLLKPVLSTGFESDTWGPILYVKIHSSNIFAQIFDLWTKVGIHRAGQYIYIGKLFDILGFNYPNYNIVNIILKIIATLSIFPVVILVFKSRLLGFLTTIVTAISYASTGSLTYALFGVYYLGIIFMNIFFIFYYYSVNRNSKLLLIFACLSLVLCYMLAAGRVYPIIILISLTEVFLLFRFGMKTFPKSLLRLVLFFIPILFLMLTGLKDYSYLGSPPFVFRDLINGNLYLLLYPFSALGNLFLSGIQNGSNNLINIRSFGDYFVFLIGNYFLIFSSLIFILVLVGHKNFIKSLQSIFAINVIASVVVFIIANSSTNVPQNYLVNYFSIHTYHALLGIYLLTLAGFFLWKWRTTTVSEDKQLLLAASVGLGFAFIFISGIWLIVGNGLHLYDAYGGINRYYTSPSSGAGLFIGSILTLIFRKIAKKEIGLAIIFSVLILLLQMSKREIDFGFGQLTSGGVFLLRNSYLHQEFQEKLISQVNLDVLKDNQPIFFYFEFPNQEKDYYEKAIDLQNMPTWLYLKLGITGDKCIKILDEEKELDKRIEFRQGIKKIVPIQVDCGYGHDITYDVKKDFYAFRVQNGIFVNITKEVLEKLGLNE